MNVDTVTPLLIRQAACVMSDV